MATEQNTPTTIPESLAATTADLAPGDDAAVIVRGTFIESTIREHPDEEEMFQALVTVKASDWTWTLERIHKDLYHLKTECKNISKAGGVLAKGAFQDHTKEGRQCLVTEWQPWYPNLPGGYEHPPSVLERLEPPMGWPNIETSYDSELHQRVFEYADFLFYAMHNTDMNCWHENIASLSLVFWANFSDALQYWQRSNWKNLMWQLDQMDKQIKSLKSTKKPTDPK